MGTPPWVEVSLSGSHARSCDTARAFAASCSHMSTTTFRLFESTCHTGGGEAVGVLRCEALAKQ